MASQIACSVEGCYRPHHAKSLCKAHYMALLRHPDGTPSREYLRQNGCCSVEGCDAKAEKKGMCAKHRTAKWHADRRLLKALSQNEPQPAASPASDRQAVGTGQAVDH